jgi:hypothetical protein
MFTVVISMAEMASMLGHQQFSSQLMDTDHAQ